MKLFLLCILLLPIFASSSCDRKVDSKIIAEVYQYQLTEEVLKNELNANRKLIDSASFANAFIQKWINEHAIIHQASLEPEINTDEINRKTESYRNQLLVHNYQKMIIEKQLDTAISEKEINDYYQRHKKDFQLKDYLVKVLYLKVSEDAPDIDKVAKWYRLNKENDETNIIQYASLYASNFYYDTTNWVYFDEITKEIPLTDIKKDKFITKKSDIKFSEENYIYFLNIIDYKLKNAVSPIEFERENIKQRIINIRILELRKQLSKDLIQKAENENAIKKY